MSEQLKPLSDGEVAEGDKLVAGGVHDPAVALMRLLSAVDGSPGISETADAVIAARAAVPKAARMRDTLRRALAELRQHRATAAAWIDFGKSWREFEAAGLVTPGVQVFVNDDAYLIGDINEIRGDCDDCVSFGRDDIVERYRVLCDPSAAPAPGGSAAKWTDNAREGR